MSFDISLKCIGTSSIISYYSTLVAVVFNYNLSCPTEERNLFIIVLNFSNYIQLKLLTQFIY